MLRRVGGSLILRDTDIEALPSGLEIGEDLDISGKEITFVGPDIIVGGDLNLCGAPVEYIDSDVEVGGTNLINQAQEVRTPLQIQQKVKRVR